MLHTPLKSIMTSDLVTVSLDATVDQIYDIPELEQRIANALEAI